jgi:hypothetical protein
MKKILIAFDGTNFSEAAFQFACKLNELQPVLLTGVFMPQVDYSYLWSYATAAGAGTGGMYVPLLEKEDADVVTENIKHFEEQCIKNGLKFRVHHNFYDFALPELKKESRFADVMILSGELFYKGVQSDHYEYLRDALQVAECPVLIVPEKYEFPQKNILAYDGSEEAVYAIKQFAYIFPELALNETIIVFAEDKEEKDFPSKQNITELAAQHYPNLSFNKLDINPKKYFASWIDDNKNSILISGSFSRSVLSQMIKRSFVSDVIKEHKVPVFVAHK